MNYYAGETFEGQDKYRGVLSPGNMSQGSRPGKRIDFEALLYYTLFKQVAQKTARAADSGPCHAVSEDHSDPFAPRGGSFGPYRSDSPHSSYFW